MEKVSSSELRLMLLKEDIKEEQIDKLLTLFKGDLAYFETLQQENELISEGVNELKEVGAYLEQLKVSKDCLFTPTLARGLSIYTGIVFEFYDKENRLSCALGAGGRYNKIITNFMDNGNNYPAVGLSFGLEPIYVILKETMKKQSVIDVYMVPLDTNIETLRLATTLRENGVNVLIEMNKKKVGKCFEYAERENIKYVMIIGENEVNSGSYKIKDMIKKEEYTLTYKELIDLFK